MGEIIDVLLKVMALIRKHQKTVSPAQASKLRAALVDVSKALVKVAEAETLSDFDVRMTVDLPF